MFSQMEKHSTLQFCKSKIEEIPMSLLFSTADTYHRINVLGFAKSIGSSKVKIGASKIVLFFDELPFYVIKIPLLGYSYRDYSTDEIQYRYFYKITDYCEREAEIFEYATLDNLQECFAETARIGDIKRIPIYMSSRCEPFSWENDSTSFSREINNSSRSIISTYNLEDDLEEWIPYLVRDYGEEKTTQLVEFLWKYDIDDFHDENVGIQNNKIKLVDYSSFED